MTSCVQTNLDNVVLCLMSDITFSTSVVKLRHEMYLILIPLECSSSSHHGVKGPIGSISATDVGQKMRQIEYSTIIVLFDTILPDAKSAAD